MPQRSVDLRTAGTARRDIAKQFGVGVGTYIAWLVNCEALRVAKFGCSSVGGH